MLPVVVRWLSWLSVVLVAVGLILWLTAPPRATLWVRSTAAPVGTARCPQGTLEDHGACVPVPVLTETAVAEFVPRLPNLPESLDAYRLPIHGSAEVVSWSKAPLPKALSLPGPGVVIRPATELRLTSANLGTVGATEVVALEAHEGWMLLKADERPSGGQTMLLLVAGLSELSEGMQPGAPMPETDSPIARVDDALWFAVRQLRPETNPDSGVGAWSDAASVALDPRNALQRIDTAAP